MTKRNATVRACAALFLAFAAASMTGCAGLKQDAAATAAAAQSADLSTFIPNWPSKLNWVMFLNGSSPVTIFAPTNEAFQALPPATLDKLAKDPAQLKALLSHHIVAGKISAANITENTVLNTVGGSKLNVSKAGEFITLDDAMVTQADVASSNGIVHKIDRVLTPPAPKSVGVKAQVSPGRFIGQPDKKRTHGSALSWGSRLMTDPLPSSHCGVCQRLRAFIGQSLFSGFDHHAQQRFCARGANQNAALAFQQTADTLLF